MFASKASSSLYCGQSFRNYDELIGTDLRAGDLIEIHRGKYRHWALFAERGDYDEFWCFHVTTDEEVGELWSSSGAKAFIKKHPLRDILHDGGKISMARVNNQETEAMRKGAKELPINLVISDLEGLKDIEVKYSPKDCNCEHYATAWKYGSAWSTQSRTAFRAIAEMVTICGVVCSVFINAWSHK